MGNELDRCDIGIVSYNSYKELDSCIKSLLQYESRQIKKIIIVENGNIDLIALLKKKPYITKCHIISPNKNLGFAKASNLIIKKSKAPFLCLINPDTRVVAPFLEKAIKYFRQNLKVGIIGPKILDPNGKVQGSARSFPSLLTAFFGRSTILTKLFPNNPITKKNISINQENREPIPVDWVSGACMIVRKQAISDVGLMDERFFMYWEDCDWCRRFWQKGWQVIYHPGLGPIVHIVGTSSKQIKLKCHYWFHKSAIMVYLKYDKSPLRLGSLICLLGGMFRFFLLLPYVIISK